jgi:hypothetical protein
MGGCAICGRVTDRGCVFGVWLGWFVTCFVDAIGCEAHAKHKRRVDRIVVGNAPMRAQR